jgi:hypothetical protein
VKNNTSRRQPRRNSEFRTLAKLVVGIQKMRRSGPAMSFSERRAAADASRRNCFGRGQRIDQDDLSLYIPGGRICSKIRRSSRRIKLVAYRQHGCWWVDIGRIGIDSSKTSEAWICDVIARRVNERAGGKRQRIDDRPKDRRNRDLSGSRPGHPVLHPPCLGNACDHCA